MHGMDQNDFETVLSVLMIKLTIRCPILVCVSAILAGCGPSSQTSDGTNQAQANVYESPITAPETDARQMRWFFKDVQDGGPMALFGAPDSDADILLTCTLAGISVSLNWVDEKPFRARSILASGARRFVAQTTFDAAAEVPTAELVVPYDNPILADLPVRGFTVSYQNGERNTFPSNPIVAKLISSCRSIFGKTETALINIWYDAEDTCRGAYDDAATAAACRKRNDLTRKLGRLNMCYGRDGEYGYQYQWHRCGTGSMKP